MSSRGYDLVCRLVNCPGSKNEHSSKWKMKVVDMVLGAGPEEARDGVTGAAARDSVTGAAGGGMLLSCAPIIDR